MLEPRFTVLFNHTGKCRVIRAARWKKRPASLSRYRASGSDVCRSTESWFRGTKLVIAQAHAWTALSSCAKVMGQGSNSALWIPAASRLPLEERACIQNMWSGLCRALNSIRSGRDVIVSASSSVPDFGGNGVKRGRSNEDLVILGIAF